MLQPPTESHVVKDIQRPIGEKCIQHNGRSHNLFNVSFKRNAVLKAALHNQLIKLCDTRWVEHHDTVFQFLENLEELARALELVYEWAGVQGDPSPPKARCLLEQ